MNNNKTDKQVHKSNLIESIEESISPNEQKLIERRMLLASKIYDAMKAKGWNQSIFADAMDQYPSVISKWLSGTHSFSDETLWEIGDKLGIDLLQVEEKKPSITRIRYKLISMPAGMGNSHRNPDGGFKLSNPSVSIEKFSVKSDYFNSAPLNS